MKKIIITMLMLLSVVLHAEEVMGNSKIILGETLPAVSLEGGAGELIREQQSLVYHRWNSESLVGRAHMLYIVSARMGVDKINQPLLDAIEAAGGLERYPVHAVQVISMINIDDVFPMGQSFARSAFETARNDEKNAHARFVLDDSSTVQKAWGLKRKNSAVILLDRDGRVVRFREGRLTEKDIADYLSVLDGFVEEYSHER